MHNTALIYIRNRKHHKKHKEVIHFLILSKSEAKVNSDFLLLSWSGPIGTNTGREKGS